MNLKNHFKEFYDKQPEDTRLYIRQTMCDFGVPNATFYQKLQRNTWRTLEKFKLAELINKDVLEFWPELKNQMKTSKL